MTVKSPKLALEVNPHNIKQVCESKINGIKYHDVSHLSIGLDLYDKLDTEISALIKSANVTTSIHPVFINFNQDIDNRDLDKLHKASAIYSPAYIEEDLALWRHGNLMLGMHSINPVFSVDTLECAIKNIALVQNQLKLDVAIENPPVNWISGYIEFWEYFNTLTMEADCYFAFDIGHYIGYCRSKNIAPYLPQIGYAIWEKIITIHVAGTTEWNWNGVDISIDRHSAKISNLCIEIAKKCVPYCKNLHCLLPELAGSILVEDYNTNVAREILKRARD